MNVSTNTFLLQLRTIHLGYGTTTDFHVQAQEIKPYLIDRLIGYALWRLDSDLESLVLKNKYRVLVERFKDNEGDAILHSTYQVSFINERGLSISVDGIFLDKNYRPFLDHGVSLAENQ